MNRFTTILLSAVAVGAIDVDGAGVEKPWSSPEVKKAFQRPAFHDNFVDGKINRMARQPWNRPQSALGWYMAVRGNEALNAAKSPAEADRIVLATVTGWMRFCSYHQSLYFLHTVYQFEDRDHDRKFWQPMIKADWEAKSIGGMKPDENRKVPALADLAQWLKGTGADEFAIQDRARFSSAQRGVFAPQWAATAEDPGTVTTDREILKFQESSLLLYAFKGRAPWSKEMDTAAREQLAKVRDALSPEQQKEADNVLRKFEADLKAAQSKAD